MLSAGVFNVQLDLRRNVSLSDCVALRNAKDSATSKLRAASLGITDVTE